MKDDVDRVGEEISEWLRHPRTMRLAKDYEERWLAQLRLLVAAANSSTDPKILIAAAQLRSLEQEVKVFGGKPLLEKRSKSDG